MRTPYVVMAVLFAVLVAIGFATGDEDEPAAAEKPASVATIARRVEALRKLRYDEIPRPVEVTAAQARREGLEDLDRSYPPERRRADEQVLKMLGLIEPDADLRELTGSLFEQGVAGYYDPRDGRLRVVTGSGNSTRVIAEMTLGHELTHALEDQSFGFTEPSGNDDRALAKTALIEGTATATMYAYVQRYFTSEETLGGLLGAAFEDTGGLPPFLEAQVVFPYVGGDAFVEQLLRRAGGRWDLVNLAFRSRLPTSSEQILHPDAYFDADEPKPVRLRTGTVLGEGWKRTAAGTWGELQTRELVGSSPAAEGWGGDRYELWQSGAKNVLVMRWRWDTLRDQNEFRAALLEWAGSKLPKDRYAVEATADGVTLVVGPDLDTISRVMRLG